MYFHVVHSTRKIGGEFYGTRSRGRLWTIRIVKGKTPNIPPIIRKGGFPNMSDFRSEMILAGLSVVVIAVGAIAIECLFGPSYDPQVMTLDNK